MMTDDERYKMLTELAKYTKLDHNEVGEAYTLIANLLQYEPYIDDELVFLLDWSVRAQLKNYTEHYEIKETVEARTTTYSQLVEKENNT